jgi:hypothetical protein
MTVWRKSVSWSKFELALTCPLALQKTIEKEYSSRFGAKSPHASMGKLVQKVFELYFNNTMNLKAGGQDPGVLQKILARVMASKWAEEEGVQADQEKEASELVAKGFAEFKTMGLLNKKVLSEVKLATQFQGFPMFGMLDFLVDGPIELYDGKGHAEETADPRQLKYYGLQLHSVGKTVTKGGFVYWRHGYRPMDLSAKGLYEFIHGDFARGKKIFMRLREGVNVLESNPSSSNCNFCNWRKTCADSYYKKTDVEVYEGVQSVGFGG